MTTPNDENDDSSPGTLSLEEANLLVEEHAGWAESIARSVARAWNLDWQQDGLDGAAMEALIFCSRRFSPDRGVPFRGYARRRIHEASTEAARKSKGWVKQESSTQQERLAREVSVELFHLFPELRSGQLPSVLDETSGEQATRASIRQLLIGATLLTTRQGLASLDPDELLDCKNTIMLLCRLEPVHQEILWRIYWDSDSMRSIAVSWDTDELNVIREHKALLKYLQKAVGQTKPVPPPRVRPGLKTIALKLKREGVHGSFSQYNKEIGGRNG
ncbi:MAG: hypothetical protein KDD64_04250 [Bdellovibrionales bacterium]|nr:hypothetical protein [Bdellovibrionales bacterium]